MPSPGVLTVSDPQGSGREGEADDAQLLLAEI